MNAPVKHYGKWRIRWVDCNKKRQSRVYKTKKEAAAALKLFLLERYRHEDELNKKELVEVIEKIKQSFGWEDSWLIGQDVIE